MIIDYNIITQDPSRETDEMLLQANGTNFSYDLFTGDIILKQGDVDFSAKWGWVPVLDFAIELRRIAESLPSDGAMNFDYTESDNKLTFKRMDEEVVIESTYAPGRIVTTYEQLLELANAFYERVAGDLLKAYPVLRENDYFKRNVMSRLPNLKKAGS